jgi:prepilin-type processing-associated H-X9-DG protein
MRRLLTMLTAVLCVTAASAIDRKTLVEYAKPLKGLKKEQLKTAIYKMSQAYRVPDYGSGYDNTWYHFYTTDRYPGAIYLGDGYTVYRLRCRKGGYSMRWRHGAAKVGAGASEIGENTTSGNGNYLLADGSVQVKNASARATVCREDVAYLGSGGPVGDVYLDMISYDHDTCGATAE